jgi:hypothetical protein
MVELDGEAE